MWRLLASAIAVALLPAPGLAGVRVRVESNKASIDLWGETATVTVAVQADPTSRAVASLAGDIVASGIGAVTASDWVFGTYFNRVGAANFPSTSPAYSGGSVTNFGSMQARTPDDLPDETGPGWGGQGQWAIFGTYTITAVTVGSVTLTFVPHWQDGFELSDTADDHTLVSNTPVTIEVAGESPGWWMCFGDYTVLDCNHVVDDSDLLAFGSLFGSACGDGVYYMGADFDLDGDVDDSDLLGFGSVFGTIAPCVNLFDNDLAAIPVPCRCAVSCP